MSTTLIVRARAAAVSAAAVLLPCGGAVRGKSSAAAVAAAAAAAARRRRRRSGGSAGVAAGAGSAATVGTSAERGAATAAATATATATAARSSLSGGNGGGSYLETWVGKTAGEDQMQQHLRVNRRRLLDPTTDVAPPPPPRSGSALNAGGQASVRTVAGAMDLSFLITGKSFLVPTLRLTRNMTPEQLRHCVAATSPRSLAFYDRSPIVLDLKHVSPDGSPHCTPATSEMVGDFLDILVETGMVPVGIANCSQDIRKKLEQQRVPTVAASTSTATEKGASTSGSGPEMLAVPIPVVETQQQPQNTDRTAIPDHDPATAEEHVTAEVATSPAPPQQPQQQQQQQQPPPQTQLVQEHAVEEEEGMLEQTDCKPMFVYGSVRGGQQIYAEGQSLVVVGSVNTGAEVMADGDIHVYGKLHGRAIAGLSGDHDAKVISTNFGPSLVGISDTFVVAEDSEEMAAHLGEPTLVRQDKSTSQLTFERLNTSGNPSFGR